MQFRDKKKTKPLASIMAGAFLFLAALKKRKVDLRKEMAADLSTGHSRRNIRFNEKIRTAFRHRWLKPTPNKKD